jgi:exopolysaccharide production protein ExoZ
MAAVLVVLCHASTTLLRREKVMVDLGFGAYGVDIFFIVSGFIMMYTTASGRTSPRDFLVRRLIRIFPLYFIMSSLMLFAALWIVPDSDTISPSLPSYVLSVLFVPHWNPQLHNLQPLIGQGWTLNYEMFFYGIFAIGLCFAIGIRPLVAVLLISFLCVGGVRYAGDNPLLLTYTNPLMMEFCLGIVLAQGFLARPAGEPNSRRTLIVSASTLMVATAGILIQNPGADPSSVDPYRFIRVGLPCAAVTLAAVLLESRGKIPRWKRLQQIGDASYSLYLTHTFVLAGARRVWQRLFEISSLPSHLAFILLATALSVFVSMLVHRFLEKPMTLVLIQAWQRVSPRRGDAAALPPS